MSDDDTLELELVDEDEGDEETLDLSLSDDGGETEEASAGTTVSAGGGWSLTLENPTIKVEKLVIKPKD